MEVSIVEHPRNTYCVPGLQPDLQLLLLWVPSNPGSLGGNLGSEWPVGISEQATHPFLTPEAQHCCLLCAVAADLV